MYKERRFHPRFSLKFTVTMCCPNQHACEVEALNISASGIQLDCNKQEFDTLLDQSSHPAECQLKCMFEHTGEVFISPARLIVSRRLSQDQFHLGMKFIRTPEEEAKKLNEFLSRQSLAK